MYCWCRKPSNGRMIGCDECEEWYHYKCVGLKTSDDLSGPWYCFVCERVRRITQTLSQRISHLESNVEVEIKEKQFDDKAISEQLEEAKLQIKDLEEKLKCASKEAENKSNLLIEKLQQAEEKLLAANKEIECLKEKLTSTSNEAEAKLNRANNEIELLEAKHVREIKLLNNNLKSKSEEADETNLILEKKLQEAEAQLNRANNEIKSLRAKHMKEIKLLNDKINSKSEGNEKLKQNGNKMKSHRSLSLSLSQKVKKCSQLSQSQTLTSQAAGKTNRDEASDSDISDDAFQPRKIRRT